MIDFLTKAFYFMSNWGMFTDSEIIFSEFGSTLALILNIVLLISAIGFIITDIRESSGDLFMPAILVYVACVLIPPIGCIIMLVILFDRDHGLLWEIPSIYRGIRDSYRRKKQKKLDELNSDPICKYKESLKD